MIWKQQNGIQTVIHSVNNKQNGTNIMYHSVFELTEWHPFCLSLHNDLQDWIFIFSVSGMMKHVLFLVQARARQPSSSSQLWFWLLASASALDRYSGGCLLSTFLYAGTLEIAKLQIYPNEKPLIGKSGTIKVKVLKKLQENKERRTQYLELKTITQGL